MVPFLSFWAELNWSFLFQIFNSRKLLTSSQVELEQEHIPIETNSSSSCEALVKFEHTTRHILLTYYSLYKVQLNLARL